MATFSELCTKANALRRLRTITLTINAIHSTGFPSGWLGYVKALLLPAPLTMFQIYSTSSYFDAAALEAMSDFCSAVVATHGQRLTRFSVHRMRISTQSIIEICHKCPSLEELFLVAHPKEIVRCLLSLSFDSIDMDGIAGLPHERFRTGTQAP